MCLQLWVSNSELEFKVHKAIKYVTSVDVTSVDARHDNLWGPAARAYSIVIVLDRKIIYTLVSSYRRRWDLKMVIILLVFKHVDLKISGIVTMFSWLWLATR